jgi:hypothetical protein
LTGPVAIIDEAALRASLARGARIDDEYWHASALRLVGDELAGLVERLRVEPCPLLASGLNPVADFKTDPPTQSRDRSVAQ